MLHFTQEERLMKYMGSKNRHSKQILPIILKDRSPEQWYVEPFVGVTEASVVAVAKAEITKRATQECSENGDPVSDIPFYEGEFFTHIVGPLNLYPLVAWK